MRRGVAGVALRSARVEPSCALYVRSCDGLESKRSTTVAGSDVLDPNDFSQEYGTSNLDVRHAAAVMAVIEAPWKLHGVAGQLANGWMVSGIGQFRSGLPYTMRTAGSLAEEFQNGTAIVGLGPGLNGSGGDNRVYGMGSDGHSYNIGRNTFRYPATWKADLRWARSLTWDRCGSLNCSSRASICSTTRMLRSLRRRGIPRIGNGFQFADTEFLTV